jgi:hypothetical protein
MSKFYRHPLNTRRRPVGGITNAQIRSLRDASWAPLKLVATCSTALMGTRGYRGAREYLTSKYLCAECREINARWEEANLCAKCDAAPSTEPR